MDFFDFLFGRKKDENAEKQASSNVTGEKYESVANSIQSVMDPVEQFVKESVSNLKQYTVLNTKELEAEAIYLAAFLYMKGSYQIDFELDYISDGLINKIPSRNFDVAYRVFSYMVKYGEGYYGAGERDYGINGYKMNIQMCSEYGSYIKNYFIRAHKIGTGKDYNH